MSDINDEEIPHDPNPEPEPVVESGKTFDQIVQEVFRGEWGQGQEQRQRLSAAGFNQNEVRKAVIRLRNSL